MKNQKVEVVDVNSLNEEEKVRYAFLLFETYFPKSYKLLEGKTFMTLDQFKQNLMNFPIDLIKEETHNLLKQHITMLLKAGAYDEVKTIVVGFNTPQERFNCYKYASYVIGTNIATGKVYN